VTTADRRAPRVAAVVVNWRRPTATRACLAAVAAVGPPGCFPIVVENGSHDFTDAELAQYRGGQRVASPTNVGFAAGANLGMRAALASGADWVWFLNDDAAPEPGSLAALLAAAAQPPYPQLLGPKIVQAEKPDHIDSLAVTLDLAEGTIQLLGHGEVDRGQYDRLAIEPLAVTGCALLMSRRACLELGGFEESYYAYFEDVDLCLRARRAELPVAVVPAARVRHDRMTTREGRQSPPSLYYSVRNHLVVLGLFCPRALWLTRLRTLRVLGRYLAFATLRSGVHARAAVYAVRRGVADYQRGIMGAAPPDIGA
jgi:GT2 family glycosyltransferase